MVKKRKSKKVSKSKRRVSIKKGSKENRILIYGLAAVIALAFIVMAFPGGNQKKDVNMQKKHKKATKENKGGIITKEGFVHMSNLKKNTDTKAKAKK